MRTARYIKKLADLARESLRLTKNMSKIFSALTMTIAQKINAWLAANFAPWKSAKPSAKTPNA
jgi:hypothetical protein